MKLTTGLVICVGLCSAMITRGQQLPDSTKSFSIKIKDGSQVRGKIVEAKEGALRIQSTTLGGLIIPKKHIKNIREVDGGTSAKYVSTNPDPSRTMFTPTAISVGKKNLVWHNSYGFFNTLEYGVTDFLSIEAGPDIISILSWGEAAGFVKAKLSHKIKPNIHIAGGIYAHLSEYDLQYNESAMAIGFATLTYGNMNANITANVAYGMIDYQRSTQPIISLSGQYRVGEHVMLIAEGIRIPPPEKSCYNHYYYYCNNPQTTIASSAGTRLMFDNFAIDLGVGLLSDSWLYVMPYGGLSYKFGSNRKYEYLYK